MLEWMHDKSVVEDLRTNFMSKTLSDCEEFIKCSWNESDNLNLAIVDKDDNYMGTVSLKNIENETAEFGITIRKCAMGKGFSYWAMEEILKIAFEDKDIKQVYWCVSPYNKRAVRFYDKHGFARVDANLLLDMIKGYSTEQINSYVWYLQKRGDA